MNPKIVLPIVIGAWARDPFWLVNEHDYCGREGPVRYEPRKVNDGVLLESSQILFRHGARGEHQRSKCFGGGEQTKYSCTMQTGFQLVSSSDNAWRTKQIVKHFESDSKSCSLGQMLDEGYDQVSRLSRYLRSVYGFLNEKSLDKVHLYSTDTQRTMGTLSIVLSHLFPESEGPFNVNTKELDEDYFGLNIPKCALHRKLRSEFADSQLYKRVKGSIPFKKCESLWRETFGTEFEIGKSDDCLLSAKCANVAVPGTRSGGTEEAKAAAELFQCTMDASFYLKRAKLGAYKSSSYYRQGKTVCEIGSYLVFKHLKESVRKGDVGGLYAIHDETFACILSALDVWQDSVWPKYAEFISFEFYSDNKVRIVRNGKEIALLASSLDIDSIHSDDDYNTVCGSSSI